MDRRKEFQIRVIRVDPRLDFLAFTNKPREKEKARQECLAYGAASER
jgi:hypothetical protein